jgi:hypothetical protein
MLYLIICKNKCYTLWGKKETMRSREKERDKQKSNGKCSFTIGFNFPKSIHFINKEKCRSFYLSKLSQITSRDDHKKNDGNRNS